MGHILPENYIVHYVISFLCIDLIPVYNHSEKTCQNSHYLFSSTLKKVDSPLLDPILLQCYMDWIELPDGVVCGKTVCPRGYTLDMEVCRANQLVRITSG